MDICCDTCDMCCDTLKYLKTLVFRGPVYRTGKRPGPDWTLTG